MHKDSAGRLLYSPSDLITFLNSPFASWMDRFHLECPGEVTPDAATEEEEIVRKQGLAHERAFLAALKAEGRDVCEIDTKESDAAAKATEVALRAGRGIVYQARLALGPFAGYPDFLERVPGRSKLGDFHYTVWDTKLARSPKPYFIIQLACYAEMIEAFQGVRPPEIRVVLGTGEHRAFRTDDYIYYYRALKKSFLEAMAEFDSKRRPAPDLGGVYGRWESHARDYLERTDDLSRVANITRNQVRRLQAAGIATLTALAETRTHHIPKLQDAVYAKVKEQAELQLRSKGKPLPDCRLLPPDPEDPRKGLALLPPSSPLDVYFDMEGYPYSGSDGLEYLFGAAYVDSERPQFVDWWAFDAAGEKAAFEGFIDWVTGRWRRDPAMHIYHYASYEVTAMRRLMGRYGTREQEVDDLLRNEVFVDLYAIVRAGLRIGTSGYSIKDLEVLYQGKRKGDVKTAGESIVFFQRWLESGDPRTWKESPHLRQIRDYNREDCESTLRLTEWLRRQQAQAGIAWIPKPAPAEEKKEGAEEKPPGQLIEESLLAGLPPDPTEREKEAERWRVHELLGRLAQFHRREAKPVWWAMFDRHDATEDELADDLDALAGLKREPGPPETIKKSKGFWYRFDPDQDTKLGTGDSIRFARQLEVKGEIENLDGESGRLLLKLGPKALGLLGLAGPPARLSIIIDNYRDPGAIRDSIHECAVAWRDLGRLTPALRDFLHRSAPRFGGGLGRNLVFAEERAADAAVRLVASLDESTLFLQGPPGAGKTTTAANMILTLIALGKRVGVTSNSHKAILNLLGSCIRQATEPFSCAKVGGEADDPFFREYPNVRYVKSPAEFVGGPHLVGGTAWFFAHDVARAGFDYLFVDEAGQVSVAHLVGMARSTRNIVLLGDQNQLAQPIQGTHPVESGLSLLDYLLQGKATIPPHLGIFLDETWRLHPRICSFISGAFYEGRLRPRPGTEKRVIRVPAIGAGAVPVEAGILYVPVEHDGNTQASDEEVETILAIVKDLLERERVGDEKRPDGPLRLEEILFVAPFNMQVRRLKAALGAGARVGSVDKFQGQEAPVVIVSMCASEGSMSARGIDFLLNRNRLNVALSRAESLAIVVGSPALARARCASVEQIALVNTYCRIVEEGSVTVG